jgi:hypothetical protein
MKWSLSLSASLGLSKNPNYETGISRRAKGPADCLAQPEGLGGMTN